MKFLFLTVLCSVLIPGSLLAEITEVKGEERVREVWSDAYNTEKMFDSYTNILRDGKLIFRLRNTKRKMFDNTGKELAEQPLVSLFCVIDGVEAVVIDFSTPAWSVDAAFPVRIDFLPSVTKTEGEKPVSVIWIAAPTKNYVEYIEIVDGKVTFPSEEDPGGKQAFLKSVSEAMAQRTSAK